VSPQTLEAAWAPWDAAGLDHLRLRVGEDGVEADGVVVGVEEGTTFRARYVVRCDPGWRTRELILDPLDGRDPLHLRSDGEGGWRDASGATLSELRGCIDVDLSATPFTNTLPIRRLGLAEGESSEIAVVYVNVPPMRVEASAQRYTCLERGAGGGLYRFQDRGTFRGFTADLPVDAGGLVLDYSGIFRRIS
jgi:uncharacterized protein